MASMLVGVVPRDRNLSDGPGWREGKEPVRRVHDERITNAADGLLRSGVRLGKAPCPLLLTSRIGQRKA